MELARLQHGKPAVDEGLDAERVRSAPQAESKPTTENVTLPETEHWWRAFANALPAAIYMTDAAGRLTFYNDAAAELWGCHPEIGKSEWCGSWKLYRPNGELLPHDECPMAVTLKTGRPVRGVQAVAARPDGTRVPFMPYPTPLRDASGAVVGAVNMLIDLSDRMHADEIRQRLASIVESSDDAIVSKDFDGIITSWNAGATRIFGYTADEVIGKPITVLMPPDRYSEEAEIIGRIRRGERIDHYETIRQRKDGRLLDISLTVSPMRNSEGRIIGASKIARDITERKQAEARRVLLTRELHHRTKNLFAVVQAVVSRSFAGKHTVEEAEAAVLDRLHSLAQTHMLLLEKEWQGTDLLELVRHEMRPFTSRVMMSGPTIILSPQAAQNFALALHELATNAAKHGALSVAGGRVIIEWGVDPPNADAASGAGRFFFHWQERDGPPVKKPERKGFGSTVLERVMAQYAEPEPEVDFARGGLSYRVTGRLDAIVANLHPLDAPLSGLPASQGRTP
jgi:two-component system, chemotaxis family, CheB/CheR fusion protein